MKKVEVHFELNHVVIKIPKERYEKNPKHFNELIEKIEKNE